MQNGHDMLKFSFLLLSQLVKCLAIEFLEILCCDSDGFVLIISQVTQI